MDNEPFLTCEFAYKLNGPIYFICDHLKEDPTKTNGAHDYGPGR